MVELGTRPTALIDVIVHAFPRKQRSSTWDSGEPALRGPGGKNTQRYWELRAFTPRVCNPRIPWGKREGVFLSQWVHQVSFLPFVQHHNTQVKSVLSSTDLLTLYLVLLSTWFSRQWISDVPKSVLSCTVRTANLRSIKWVRVLWFAEKYSRNLDNGPQLITF